jgi:mRNA interferase MazF
LGIVEITRGDVVLMVAPSDLGRPRPGIVVQSDEFAVDLSTVFVCPVTSDLQDKLPLRPLIEAARENGLRLRSQIMTDKMLALRRDRIRRVIGRIDTQTSEQLDRALLVVLGLTRISGLRDKSRIPE